MPAAPIPMRVNGREAQCAVDEQTPLLYVLRNDLQLKGTRFGCGVGACGSCTVLLDGRAVNSCETPMWAARDHDITTIEGLGTPELPHALQAAILDTQAAQCGYCINGIVLSLAPLCAQPGPVTEAQLQAALSRHLCRCGTHMRILAAARQVLGLQAP